MNVFSCFLFLHTGYRLFGHKKGLRESGGRAKRKFGFIKRVGHLSVVYIGIDFYMFGGF